MTAEIGIGNQSGVVLAADSAVSETDYSGRVQAIYNSAQKLYTLGWQHYVGLLIYGNASYEGTPWSVLFNHYDKKIGETRLDYINDYQTALLDYLAEEPLLKLELGDDQSTIFRVINSLIYTLCCEFQQGNYNVDEFGNFVYSELNDFASNYLQNAQQNNSPLAVDNYSEDQFVNEFYNQLLKIDTVNPNAEGLVIKLMKSQSQEIGISLNGDNQYHNLFTEAMNRMWMHALYIILFYGISSGQWKWNGYSGVVIAGYGIKDNWPVVKELKIYGYVGSHPIFTVEPILQIGSKFSQGSFTNHSLFIPFAQSDVANTLCYGYSSEIYNNMMDTLINKTALSSEEKEKVSRQIDQYFIENYTRPFNSEIAMLNIPELAEIAETMIKVTSFERQYNGNHYATVGGPIDILSITPGDGPVWIKKKHYYDPNTRDNLGKQLRLQRGK